MFPSYFLLPPNLRRYSPSNRVNRRSVRRNVRTPSPAPTASIQGASWRKVSATCSRDRTKRSTVYMRAHATRNKASLARRRSERWGDPVQGALYDGVVAQEQEQGRRLGVRAQQAAQNGHRPIPGPGDPPAASVHHRHQQDAGQDRAAIGGGREHAAQDHPVRAKATRTPHRAICLEVVRFILNAFASAYHF